MKQFVSGTIIFIVFVVSFLSCKTQEGVTDADTKHRTDQQFKSYFHDAIGEKMIGHYDRAIELFEACLTLDQNSSAVHFALSDLYEIQGNKTKAISYAEKAYNLDKTNKWYALRLADLYYAIGDYQKSAEFFELGIDENEQNLDLKFKYAESLIYSNQYLKAIVVMDAIEVETGKIPALSLTKHDMYLALGEKEKAEAELNSLIADNPSNIENRIIVGEYFLKTDQLEKAQKMAEETIRIDSDNGAAYIILAEVYLRLGKLETGFQNLKIAFQKDDVTLERKVELLRGLAPHAFEISNPNAKIIETNVEELFILIYDPVSPYVLLHSSYATFLLSQGKKTEALEKLKLICELKGSDYNSWQQLLNTEYELNAYHEMFLDGQKAVELFPSQPMLYLLTGIGAYESGKFTDAEEYLFLGKDLVVHDNELAAEFYYHLGKVSCLQKNYSEGYAYFEQSKTIFPQGAKVYGAKAKFLFEERKIAEAESEIKSGLSLDPNNAVILHIQGLIYLSEKNYPSAVKTLEKAALNDFKNGIILESFGDALFLNGEKEKAIEIWLEAEKNGNNSTLLKRKIADKMYYEN